MFMHTTSNRLGSLDISADDDITTSYRSVNNSTDLFNGNAAVSKKYSAATHLSRLRPTVNCSAKILYAATALSA